MTQGWEVQKLGSISSIIMGQSPDSRYYSEEELGKCFLQGCSEFGGSNPIPKLFCSQGHKTVSQGAILFSVRAPVGRINVADREYIIGRGLAGIYATKIDAGYLKHFLLSNECKFQTASQGSTFEAISSVELAKWPVEFPSAWPEQSKIAEVLSIVDKAIEQTDALISKQQRIKTGLMQDLLTRGIDEHGNVRSEETHKFKDSLVGRLPKDWECTSLGSITQVGQGLQIPIAARHQIEGPGRYLYITVQYLNGGQSDPEYIQDPLESVKCNIEDILFTRTGNTGQIISGLQGVLHNNFFKVEYDRNRVDKDFLIHFLRWQPTQDRIMDLAGTTTIPDLKHGDFYSLNIGLPGVLEQRLISHVLRQINTSITKELAILSKLRSLKSGLMQDLLTGRVRITPLLEDMEVATDESSAD